MGILSVGTASKWADRRFGNSAVFRRWLSLYVLILILSVLGDITYCKLTPSSIVWAQVLPELHYIGIILAATCLGAAGGFAAGCGAGVLHTTAITLTCSQSGSLPGQVVMFAAVGIMAGLISKSCAFASIRARDVAYATGEPNRGVSLSELGRMMPEVVQQFLTPIASIEGAGYVLEEADLSDDKRQEFVNIILKECRHLELLVELLDFTQARFSTYEETNVSRLLDEIVERYRTDTDSRIALRNVSQQHLPRLRCDPKLINYALQSLTTNAIRAIPQYGSIELSANLLHEEIVIYVKARAEPGSPLDTSLSRDFSGIDLAVVQQIVNRHHGSIRVDPSSGGATISMILPLKSR